MTELFNMNKVIRYSVVFVGIFILLKLIPRANIEMRDALISSIVLFSLYVIVENIFTKASFCSNDKEKLDGNLNPTLSSIASAVNTSQFNKVQSPIVQNPVSAIASSPSTQSMPEVSGVAPSMPSTQSMPSMPSMQTMPSTQSMPQQAERNKLFNNDELKPGECKDCVKRTFDSDGMESYTYKTAAQRYESGKTRAEAGPMKSEEEMQYTDYFIMPVTREDEGSFEEGYSMLPPSKWYPVPPHPPVCVTEKKCPVCPVLTTGAYVDLKEWNDSRRITPGDTINIDYARDKLNSGR